MAPAVESDKLLNYKKIKDKSIRLSSLYNTLALHAFVPIKPHHTQIPMATYQLFNCWGHENLDPKNRITSQGCQTLV